MSAEEERAALYRRQAAARERAALQRWAALAGSAAATMLLTKTEALRHDDGWDPVEYVTEQERVANG
jgi:hypothetical protein